MGLPACVAPVPRAKAFFVLPSGKQQEEGWVCEVREDLDAEESGIVVHQVGPSHEGIADLVFDTIRKAGSANGDDQAGRRATARKAFRALSEVRAIVQLSYTSDPSGATPHPVPERPSLPRGDGLVRAALARSAPEATPAQGGFALRARPWTESPASLGAFRGCTGSNQRTPIPLPSFGWRFTIHALDPAAGATCKPRTFGEGSRARRGPLACRQA